MRAKKQEIIILGTNEAGRKYQGKVLTYFLLFCLASAISLTISFYCGGWLGLISWIIQLFILIKLYKNEK